MAWIQWALWYEVKFYSDRVAFGGGVLAGGLIQLLAGLDPRIGYGFEQSVACVIFGLMVFVAITIVSKVACKVGEKYGDPKPLRNIMEEVAKGK